MDTPEALIDYLVHFHATRDYFECHEILEEYWKETAGSPFADTWVGLIQIAVGSYHQRRGNTAGAVKMLGSACARLKPEPLNELGFDGEKLALTVRERLELLQRQPDAAFADLALPIADKCLLERCLERCERLGVTWLAPSDMHDPELIHRHTMRDRSGVIRERLAQIERKQRERREPL